MLGVQRSIIDSTIVNRKLSNVIENIRNYLGQTWARASPAVPQENGEETEVMGKNRREKENLR